MDGLDVIEARDTSREIHVNRSGGWSRWSTGQVLEAIFCAEERLWVLFLEAKPETYSVGDQGRDYEGSVTCWTFLNVAILWSRVLP